jgi:hypothetical protein
VLRDLEEIEKREVRSIDTADVRIQDILGLQLVRKMKELDNIMALW